MHLAFLTRRLRWPCLLLAVLGAGPAVSACSIPVFRYALERWELSPYEVLVFHRGSLPEGTRSILDALPGKANVLVTPVDLDGPIDPAMEKLWQGHGRPAALPWAIVRRPDAGVKSTPIWSGPCEAARLRQLIDSPARQQTLTALSEGKCVFVLLRSGDQAADAAAETLLRGRLAKLEKLIKLPEQRGDGPRMRLALPLTVGFAVVPLGRDTPGEEAFVHILLQAEKGLANVRGPIAFPIFGRGRLLGALHGAELDADNVFEVVNFLCGECSCEVKELNPGMDLPIAADWPAIFARIGPAPDSGPETPPGTRRIAARVKPGAGLVSPGSSKAAGMAPTEVRVTVSAYPPPADAIEMLTAMPPTPPHRRWLWLATTAAAVLVLITGTWAWMQRRAIRAKPRGER